MLHLLLLALTGLAVLSGLPAQTTTAARSAKVDALFEKWNRKDSPGAAVLVIHKGEVVHRKGYGMADLEHGIAIAPNTVFDIASVSKQFCGLAIALLVEQKRLALDDDVRKYVPWVPDFGENRKITIRHLVHHTSGLRDWPGTFRIAGWKFDDVITFEQILKMLRHQRDLNFDPGAEYSYSNTGYNLLAHTIEKVSGISFAKWTKGHFFDALGMRDTHFQDDHTRVIPARASSYRNVKGQWKRIDNNLTAVGSSSLFTTIDDLAKWTRNFETKKVAGAAAIRRMHTRGTLDDGREIDYCFGVKRSSHGGLPTIDHTGSWAGFRTFLVRYPEQEFAAVVLANTPSISPARFGKQIANIYVGDEMTPNAGGAGAFARRPIKPVLTNWRPLTGRYHSRELDTTYTVAIEKGKLMLRHFRNEDVTLASQGEKDVFKGNVRWVGAVRFHRDADEKVIGLDISDPGRRSRNILFDRVAR